MTEEFYLKAHTVARVDNYHGPLGVRIEPAGPQRQWMNEFSELDTESRARPKGLANRCLPLLMANQMGWNVVFTHEYLMTSCLPGEPFIFMFSDPKGMPRIGPMNNFGDNVVTWPMPWVFETPPGWDLLIVPPPNHFLPAGVTCLSGLVETDHAYATFTLNWRVEPQTSVWIKEGDLLATLIPYPTAALEEFVFSEDNEVPEGFEAWSQSREEVMHREDPTPVWQKHYWNEAKRRKIRRNQIEVEQNSERA